MLSAAGREIRSGIWKIHILHHAAAHDVWGMWLLDELAEHGQRLSPLYREVVLGDEPRHHSPKHPRR
ncbi:MAG TPA: hypothetical protein VF516_25510 [Kofleriaceae bacterium]